MSVKEKIKKLLPMFTPLLIVVLLSVFLAVAAVVIPGSDSAKYVRGLLGMPTCTCQCIDPSQ